MAINWRLPHGQIPEKRANLTLKKVISLIFEAGGRELIDTWQMSSGMISLQGVISQVYCYAHSMSLYLSVHLGKKDWVWLWGN